MDSSELRKLMLGSFDRVKGSKFITDLIRAHQSLREFNRGKGFQENDLTHASRFTHPLVEAYFSVEQVQREGGTVTDNFVNLGETKVNLEDLTALLRDDIFASQEKDEEGKTPVDRYIEACGDRALVKGDLTEGPRMTNDFFIREIKSAKSDDGVTYFEVSPVVDSAAQYKERLTVEVSSNNVSLLELLHRSEHKIMSMELGALPSGRFRLISCRPQESRNKSFAMVELSGAEQTDLSSGGVLLPDVKWVETTSADKDFTYTDSLEDDIRLHGQWSIADRHLQSLQSLGDAERFGRFMAKGEAKCVGRIEASYRGVLQNFILTREDIPAKDYIAYIDTKGKASMSDMEWSEGEKSRYDAVEAEIEALRKEYATFSSQFQPPQNIAEMLGGPELHVEKGEPEWYPVIYDLDLPFAEQFTHPGEVEDDLYKYTLFSQMRNYSYQLALRDLMVENAGGLSNVLVQVEKDLVATGIVPMENPYRTKEDFDVLNREHAQLVGGNLIAAVMRHQGGQPNQQMKSLMPGAVVDRFMADLDYENLKDLPLSDMLAATNQNIKGILDTSRSNIVETVEREAYAPGKSPRALQEAKLRDAEAGVKEKMIVGGIVAEQTEKAFGAMESLSIFR